MGWPENERVGITPANDSYKAKLQDLGMLVHKRPIRGQKSCRRQFARKLQSQ